MIGIRIYNEFLELSPNTSIGFELNSPCYFGANIDSIQGGFSFPFTIPLSGRNKSILKHPNRIDNHRLFIKDTYCEVWTTTSLLFSGKATIQQATRTTAKMYILINDITDLKSVMLSDANLGTATFGTDQATATAHAKDTADNPGNHNHIFFPVKNNSFTEADDTGTITDEYINWYDTSPGSFVSNTVVTAIVPFLKLNHVLDKGLAAINYTLVNNWQVNDELKRLVLYNNRSIHNGTGWELSTDLSNHANPSTSYANLIKNLCRLFCLAPFEDKWNKQVELLPLKSLIGNGVRHDWTRKAAKEYTVKELNSDLVGGFQYDDMYDKGDPAFWFESDPPSYQLIADIETVANNAPSSYYYEYTTDTLFYNELDVETTPEEGTVYSQISSKKSKLYLPYLIAGSNNDPYVSKLRTILMEERASELNVRWLVPEIWEEGSFIFDANGVNLSAFKPFDDRLLFYRGMQPATPFGTYPMASNSVFDYNHNQIAGEQYSLLWNDHLDSSLFNMWWKEWLEILQMRKVVTRQILLTPKDIIQFNFKDKVRIDNQNYLVKRLRVTLTMRGLQPTEAELVSIV